MTPLLSVRQFLEQRRLVFGFIYSLTRDVDAAEEIFQEVSVAVLEELSRNPRVDRFLPWVLGIARNRAFDFYRRRNRREPASLAMAETVGDLFEHNQESREAAARRVRGLLDCVDELPLRQRQIVELRYRDRKPLARVAESVGWKPESVKVAVSKIRRALLDCLRGKDLLEGADAP